MATLTVTAVELRKAARWAKPSAGTTIPVLGNVRVSIAGSQLVIAWFDWETCLLARVAGKAADGDQAATVLVPAVQFADAIGVAAGPKGPSEVEVTVHDGDKVDLVTRPATAKAHRESVGQDTDPAAYPALPSMPVLTGWTPADVFVPAVAQIARCCADETHLPLISAVHFIPGQDRLELQGTNRFILGLHEVPFNRATPVTASADKGRGFLVPARLAVKFATGCEGPVFIGSPGPEGMVLLSDAWHTMVTKATAGDYPRVRSIVARTPPPVAVFGCDAVKLAAVAGVAGELLDSAVQEMIDAAVQDPDDDRKEVDIRRNIRHAHDGHGMFITASQAGVEIFAVHQGTQAELGRWLVSSPDDPGDEVTVCVNPGYLARLLPPEGTVTVALSTPAKPVRVTVDGSPYEGVACPVKLTPPVREDATA